MSLSPISEFKTLVPKEVEKILMIISREGFALTLVGGAVRDYLLTGKLGDDLDFELRHIFEFVDKEWTDRVDRLSERLSSKYNYRVEKLAFHSFRIKIDDFELEFSSPRLELFDENLGSGHSNFSVKLISNLEYQKSFARRDFKLNSIGIEIGAHGDPDNYQLIDPFNGRNDLINKKLNFINDDFYKDPVRLLRSIRFKLKLDFEINFSLEKFNIEKLSTHYLKQEAYKVNILEFCFYSIKLVNDDVLNTRPDIKSVFSNIIDSKKELDKFEEYLFFVFESNDCNLDHWQGLFQLKSKLINDLKYTKENLALLDIRKFENYNDNNFKLHINLCERLFFHIN